MNNLHRVSADALKVTGLWGEARGVTGGKVQLDSVTPRTSMSCLLDGPATVAVMRVTSLRGQGNSWRQTAFFIF